MRLMPAPSITLTRGPVTHTMAPIDLRGFRITGSISSASESADWQIFASASLQDASVVDANDQTFRATETRTLPLNEAPTLTDAAVALQGIVDQIYDAIPTPAP